MAQSKETNNFIVYKITNTVNNKVYIGITARTLEKRWRYHCNSAHSENDRYVFHRAIIKYGENAFVKEVLASNLNKEEAQQLEKYYINTLDTFYLNGHGYNMTYGGEFNDHLKGSLCPGALFTEDQISQIYILLKTTKMLYTEILSKIGVISNNSTRAAISRINHGHAYTRADEQYPLREDGRVVDGIHKIGEKNPMAKLTNETASSIIKMLETTDLSQTKIANQYNITYNTVNLINRCLIWNHLHKYKNNIRKERTEKENELCIFAQSLLG